MWNGSAKRRNAYRISVGQHGRRPLGISAINKMGGATDWIHLAQYTDKWQDLVNAIINLQIP
jgi:hypothetical protein